MKTQFNLIQVSFDGSHVTDSTHNTIEDAQNASANLGSKWYFYPLSVITKGKTIAETGGYFVNMQTKDTFLNEKFKGKRFATLVKEFKKVSSIPALQNANWEEFESYFIYN